MSAVFSPFSAEEVESIRSVVMVGQQSDDMLLANCTKRPIAETRAFIRRFKKTLLDPHTTPEEIAVAANQQYIPIITAARSKRNIHGTMSATKSMFNLAGTLGDPADSLPFKFRSKVSRDESDSEQNVPRQSLPTRSRSVQNGLNVEFEEKKKHVSKIEVIPPFDCHFPHSCKTIEDVEPGLAAVLRTSTGPSIICRVLAVKENDGNPLALVAFFQQDIKPCYVPLHHLVMLKHGADADLADGSLTVDAVLKRIMVQAQSAVLVSDDLEDLENDASIAPGHRKAIIFQALACAAQLQLLSFICSWEVPLAKQAVMFEEVGKMTQAKFRSTEEINARCRVLISQILEYLKN